METFIKMDKKDAKCAVSLENQPLHDLCLENNQPHEAASRAERLLSKEETQRRFQISSNTAVFSQELEKSLLNNNVSSSHVPLLSPGFLNSFHSKSLEKTVGSDRDTFRDTTTATDAQSNYSVKMSDNHVRENHSDVSASSVKLPEIEKRKRRVHRTQELSKSNLKKKSSEIGKVEESGESEGNPQKTPNAAASWNEFLVGLRTGHYEMSDSYQHHLDPEAPLLLPEDYGQSDEESDSASEKAPKPSRKSKVVEAKEALNKGQEHINAKGKLIRARQMGDGCGKKACRFKCEQRITKEARTNIFNYFWNLGNHQLQWLFIAMHTSVRAPKQRTQDPQRSRRKTSRSYYFRQGASKIPVCKTMFLNTLDVSDSWVDTAIAKAANGVAVAPDCRGRHSKVLPKAADGQPKSKAKKSKRRRDRIKAGPDSTSIETPKESVSREIKVENEHLPLQNIVNRCEQEVEKTQATGIKDEAVQELKIEVDINESALAEENHNFSLHSSFSCGVMHECNDLESPPMEEGEVDTTLLSPKVDIQTASDASELSYGAADGNSGCSGASWSDEVGAKRFGLLGAAAIPEAFRHHLDPDTLCLRELPNGAVFMEGVEVGEFLDGSDDASERPSSSQKRRREPARWRSNLAKEALNTGKEHINMKGKLVRARRLREGCDDSCRFKCKERMAQVDREAIFKHFWSLGDHQLQWLFIARQTRVRAPKHRTQDPERSRRKTTRSYFFSVMGRGEVPVCKTMFLRTLDVSDSWVETAIGKVADGVAVAADQRGRHRKVARRLPDAVSDSVREHIALFPRSGTPPSAKGYKRQCLADGHSVSQMHRMYLDWMRACPERADSEAATERQYRDILNAVLKSESKTESQSHRQQKDCENSSCAL